MDITKIILLGSIDKHIREKTEELVTGINQESKMFLFIAVKYLKLRFNIMAMLIRQNLLARRDGLKILIAISVKEGDTVLDIGANVGWVTELLSYGAGNDGKVYSFEPSKKIYKILKRRKKLLKLDNVHILNYALGEKEEEANFYEYNENYGGASSFGKNAWPGHTPANENQMKTYRLDDKLNDLNIKRVRLIKIDVQGYEIKILEGAKELLTSKEKPILYVEIERDALAALNFSVTDLLNEIKKYGYLMYSFREGIFVEVINEKDIPVEGHDDVICLDPKIHNNIIDKLS